MGLSQSKRRKVDLSYSNEEAAKSKHSPTVSLHQGPILGISLLITQVDQPPTIVTVGEDKRIALSSQSVKKTSLEVKYCLGHTKSVNRVAVQYESGQEAATGRSWLWSISRDLSIRQVS